MARVIEVRVPDIGDFKNVPVVEILAKAGDTVEIDQSLLIVESDKATMDIPSPAAGRISELRITIGETISQGDLIALLEVEAQVEPANIPGLGRSPDHRPEIRPTGSNDCELLVIGGGPGGYSAAFRAADLGLNVILIERYPTLGGVCLNVGCIPSKALLHVAAVSEEAERLSAYGVTFAAPDIDLSKLRYFKSVTVGRLTDGLGQMAKMRKVDFVQGEARFTAADRVSVDLSNGLSREITFSKCIIAAGSSPVALPVFPEDPRIVNSTGALELPSIPRRMLVVGGGIIGLEMATVYSALGARVDLVELFDKLLPGVDRDLVKIWQKRNAHRFDRVMLATKVSEVGLTPDGLSVTFEGTESASQIYDMILQAAGRKPNSGSLALEAAGVRVEGGIISVDREMRTNVDNIFAVGDIVGQPMLAHKAVHQGHVAAEVAAGRKTGFDAKIVPSVAYTDPEIAWVGVTEDEAKAKGLAVEVSRFPWSASGRAIANGADYGLTKLIFSKESGRIVGGAIIGPAAGDIIGEVCLAIEMGADAVDIGKTIHPHPTLGETIGMAAEVAEGVCTDIPPQRGKR
ncbi:dihydrolipoyl dehydrogenase [Mesorhizobium shangrilense]|uniref:Dihydrolipoyl dehydrogenase n=1 Tax=Mesorhizobium shangrilense TaxID=460060 RepID=A0ABV2DH14_9HYPH